ncbi:hypothetical protein MLA71_003409 [Salmonella enterica subsp. enterica serovar Infantis]|nr:hypothetical protein [Salmonella enterica subsp. enterica serovar Infantis]
MADTASLIARVKTEGVEEASRQLTALGRTSEQVDAAVNRMTGDVGKTNKAMSDAARGGLSSFRNAAGQVGFQVQDMVVQLQAGTSAFVAIGQQGSQLAGAFGPGGAVLGAVIALAAAVGGVLYKSLGIAGANMDDLNKRAGDLSKSFQITKDGTLELSDSFVQAANSADGLSQNMVKLLSLQVDQNLSQTTQAIEDQRKAWEGNSVAAQTSITTFRELSASGMDVGKAISDISSLTPEYQAKLGNLNQFLDDQASKYGVNKQLIIDVLAAERDYADSNTPAAYQKVADAKGAVASAATKNRDAALEEARIAQQLSVNLETLSKQSDVVAAAQQRQSNATNSATTALKAQSIAIVEGLEARNKGTVAELQYQAALDKRQFAEKNADNPELIKRFNAARDEAYKQDVDAYTAAQNRKSAIADNKAIAQAKRDETAAQRQQKQAQDFLDTLQRQNQDELAAIDAQEQQKLEKLQAFRDSEAISQQQFEDAKTQIALDADAKRNEILQRQTEERIKKQFSADAYVTQMQALADSEFAELDRQYEVRLQKLNDFHSQGFIAEDKYQQTLSAINDEYALSRAKATGDAFGDMAGNIGTALGEASTAYKAFAIAQATIATYTSAIEAYKSTAAIPVVGPFLAPVAAAAAVAAGMANIGKIRSAREQGGSLAAGQMSTIAERGKPEVIMPAGASRVRTAEQMRQIMGESAGKSGGENITIVNNTTGRVDSVSQERDDEGRLRIIISETVASALQDSNSAISKSRRATRGQPGY